MSARPVLIELSSRPWLQHEDRQESCCCIGAVIACRNLRAALHEAELQETHPKNKTKRRSSIATGELIHANQQRCNNEAAESFREICC